MPIYRPVCVFFFNFFISLHFCVRFVSDILVIYRYIGDIERFFSIFPRNDFLLQKSCRNGPTLDDISSIFRDIFNPVFKIVNLDGHASILACITVP